MTPTTPEISWVSSQGWQLLYVTKSQLPDPERFVDQVVDVARARHDQFARAHPA